MATDPSDTPKRPTGRDEVVASLVQAARELFAERGISQVSVRAIAERANVNPGLLHRHFESKQALVAACFAEDAIASQIADDIVTPAEAIEHLLAEALDRPSMVRILASAVLGSLDLAPLFPTDGPMRQYHRVMRRARDDDDLRVDFLLSTAAGLGWALFGPTLEFVAEVDPSDHDKIERRISERLQAIASGELVDDD